MLIGWIEKLSRGWRLWAVLALTTLIWWLFDRNASAFSDTIGKPTIPDYAWKIWNLYDYASSYSPVAIDYYRTSVAPYDFILPLALGLTLGAGLLRVGAPGRWPLLPLLAALVDYGENAGIHAVLTNTDPPIALLGMLTSVLTKVKFAAYILALCALIYFTLRRRMSQRG